MSLFQGEFVNLHNHSAFSLLDSMIRIPELVRRAKDLGQKSLAITDHGTLAGAVKFTDECRKHGIKPLIGEEFYLAPDSRHRKAYGKGENSASHLIIFAKNDIGWQNIMKLSSLAFIEGFYKKPRIDHELLYNYSEGLIVSSACIGGAIATHLKGGMNTGEDSSTPYCPAKAFGMARWFTDLFGDDFYYEIQSYNRPHQEKLNAFYRAHFPASQIICSSDCHYLFESQHDTHDTLIAAQSVRHKTDPLRWRFPGDEFWLKSEAEVLKQFLPNEVYNTGKLADKIEFELPLRKTFYMPELPADITGFDQVDTFVTETLAGIEKRLDLDFTWDDEEDGTIHITIPDSVLYSNEIDVYRARLEYELNILIKAQYVEYFLLLHDLKRWCRSEDIFTGPGRGCLTGSSPVLMSDGNQKKLDSVVVGDNVFTHTGSVETVRSVFRYEIDETLLSIRCAYGSAISMTKDHKVWACKTGVIDQKWNGPRYKDEPDLKFEWIKAEELSIGDWVFKPTPYVMDCDIRRFDLSSHSDTTSTNSVMVKSQRNKPSSLSIHEISRATGACRNSVRFVLDRYAPKKSNPRHDRSRELVEGYLVDHGSSISQYAFDYGQKIEKVSSRYLPLTLDFLEIIGRWIGDGWISKRGYWGICYHSSDEKGISQLTEWLSSHGFYYTIHASKTKKVTQVEVSQKNLTSLFSELFPFYESSSQTKDIPTWIKHLPVEKVRSILRGYHLADGHADQYKYKFTTVSKKLAEDLQFLLSRLNVPSKIRHSIREYPHLNLKERDVFEVTTPKYEDGDSRRFVYKPVPGGLAYRIREISEVKSEPVFDITVDKDHSYVSEFAVHNSGAGSLVLFSLFITDVDPVERKCPFERFINPGRIANFSPPDVDLDFPQSKRGVVIEYLRERYGRDRVCQIGTYASLGPAALIRKLKVPLGLSEDDVAELTAAIPASEGSVQGRGAAGDIGSSSTLNDVHLQSPQFARKIEKMGYQGESIMHYGKGLAYLGAHASTHASGLIITNRPVDTLVPLMSVKSGASKDDREVMSQMDMSDVEAIGLVKYDILGLKTLDVLAYVRDMIRKHHDKSFSFADIDMDDPLPYRLLHDGRTIGIFQAEGGGFGSLLPQARPESVEELAVLTSLCRPGPMQAGITKTYLERKQGRISVEYLFPQLEPILGGSLGCIVFQEDIMAIAAQCAGYTLAEADDLRKIMGKKQRDKMPYHREKFLAGLIRICGVDEFRGERLWAEIEMMSEYVFNRAHAISYSYLTAWCAWAKAYYSSYFLAAAMTSETLGDGDELPGLIQDARYLSVSVARPDINVSERYFHATSDHNIQIGFLGIHRVGSTAVKTIIEERDARGPYRSREDLIARVPKVKVNSAVIDALDVAGAFDGLDGRTRRVTVESLIEELRIFGFFLSGHPCERLRAVWTGTNPQLTTLSAIIQNERTIPVTKRTKHGERRVFEYPQMLVRGIVMKYDSKKSKSKAGQYMHFLDLEDETGVMKIFLRQSDFDKLGIESISKGMGFEVLGCKSNAPSRMGYLEPTLIKEINFTA